MAFLKACLLASLLEAQGNKFFSRESDAANNSDCAMVAGENVCERWVPLWGCDTPWSVYCREDHPLGPDHNEDTLDTMCHAHCLHAIVNGTNGTNITQVVEQKMEAIQAMIRNLYKLAAEARASGNLEKAKHLEEVANAEAQRELGYIPGLDLDPELLEAEDQAARAAAVRVVESDFEGETDVIFSGVRIDQGIVQHYHDSIRSLGIECGDREEADELAQSEQETLLKAANSTGDLTKFQSNQGKDTAAYMENQCSEDTLDLDFFIGNLQPAHHLHANSSYLLQAYSVKMHRMSHQLEFHAKAAMVLHDDSNGLAHHFVAHLKHQDAARVAKATGIALESPEHLKTSVHHLLHEVARSDLTDKQVARMHQLDEKHHEAIHGESKEMMCVNHAKRQQKAPAASPLHSQAVKDYIDCNCEQNQPTMVCQAKHGMALRQEAKQLAQKLSQATKAMQLDMDQAKEASLAALARAEHDAALVAPDADAYAALARRHGLQSNASKVAIGPCKTPFACKVCINGANCIEAPFPKTGKDSFEELKTIFSRSHKPPCLSGGCTACLALAPPIEPIQFKATIGFQATCTSNHAMLTSFAITLSFHVCVGGREMQEVLEWLGISCMQIASTRYHPFIGKLVPASFSLNLVVVRVTLEASVPVHELTQPCYDHCKTSKVKNDQKRICDLMGHIFPFSMVCARSAYDNCVTIFQNARGNGDLKMKIDLGLLWWWETVYTKKWYF
ncbi:unnamed protein product [Effrenium voratum]|uniref:Uncharacterized protein n=1 Tax=Effrenium voratum TaxID=2562239 RepID=A0AA36NFJ2_9DINO|nr:unnamed protein product [Effrenium voratum]